MKKIFNRTLIILVFFLVTSCADTLDNVKKGLGGGKRTTTDEFLVKKKDPLTLPPKWDSLPVPGQGQSISLDDSVKEEVNDIEELIQLGKSQQTSIDIQQDGNIEDSFLKKIKRQ